MVHLIRGDVRHPVRVVDDLFRLRVQPAVAFDQTDAVRRSATDPRLANKIRVASKSIRVLRQLGFKQALRQHKAERTPHIAPVFFVGVDRILRQIVGVLAGRVREAGRVQFRAADSAAVVDLNCAARRAGPVAAVGIARDHRVDVRGIFLVLIGNGSAELDCEVFVGRCQRERHSRCVDFLSLDRAAIL